MSITQINLLGEKFNADMTVDEAATKSGRSRKTILRAITASLLQADKPGPPWGKGWRIKPQDLQEWISKTRSVVKEKSMQVDSIGRFKLMAGPDGTELVQADPSLNFPCPLAEIKMKISGLSCNRLPCIGEAFNITIPDVGDFFMVISIVDGTPEDCSITGIVRIHDQDKLDALKAMGIRV